MKAREIPMQTPIAMLIPAYQALPIIRISHSALSHEAADENVHPSPPTAHKTPPIQALIVPLDIRHLHSNFRLLPASDRSTKPNSASSVVDNHVLDLYYYSGDRLIKATSNFYSATLIVFNY